MTMPQLDVVPGVYRRTKVQGITLDVQRGRWETTTGTAHLPVTTCPHGAEVPIHWTGRTMPYKCDQCDAQRAATREQARQVRAMLRTLPTPKRKR